MVSNNPATARERALDIPEILGNICQFIPRQSIPNVRRTSSSFNQACRPFLQSKCHELDTIFSKNFDPTSEKDIQKISQEAKAIYYIIIENGKLDLLKQASEYCPNINTVQINDLYLFRQPALTTFLGRQYRLRKMEIVTTEYNTLTDIHSLPAMLAAPLLTSLTLPNNPMKWLKSPWTLLKSLLAVIPGLLHLDLGTVLFTGHAELDQWEQESAKQATKHPLRTMEIKDAVLPMLRFFQLNRILPSLDYIYFDGFDKSPVPPELFDHVIKPGERASEMQTLANRVYYCGPPLTLRRMKLSRAVTEARLTLLLARAPHLTELVVPRPRNMYFDVFAQFPDLQLKQVTCRMYSFEESTTMNRLTTMSCFRDLEDLTLEYNAEVFSPNKFAHFYPATISPVMQLCRTAPTLSFGATLRRLVVKTSQNVLLNSTACGYYKTLLRHLPHLTELDLQEKMLDFQLLEGLGRCCVPDCAIQDHDHGVSSNNEANAREDWWPVERPLLKTLRLVFDSDVAVTTTDLETQVLKRFRFLEEFNFGGPYPDRDWGSPWARRIRYQYPCVVITPEDAAMKIMISPGS
ncbi:hypothetical protein BG006_011327 [Podila minutissima]|uniref:F-box domain-containing protein n=1 Tax=Podila minutissima TaxID=64525 RepID=A0A9P5SEW3_9FUNG|nr:hypothetical protein BG006_011327 [Podila minutissima]